jgi:hypothetical protein
VSSDWTVRAYEDADENCVVSMWLKGYANAREVQDLGLKHASENGHPDQIRFWRIHQPIVTGLLRRSKVLVACDPARSTYADGLPAVIWAWACVSDDAVHWVAVKHSVVQAKLGQEIVKALLGDRLEHPQATTFELADMRRAHAVPKSWFRDPGWLSSMRQLSTRMLDRDDLFASVGRHVLDAQRAEWRQKSERAA